LDIRIRTAVGLKVANFRVVGKPPEAADVAGSDCLCLECSGLYVQGVLGGVVVIAEFVQYNVSLIRPALAGIIDALDGARGTIRCVKGTVAELGFG